MKLPFWAKLIWWMILVAAGGSFVYYRREPIIGGQGTGIDLFVVAIGAALLLAPLFIEMEFLGVKLKQQIDETKKELENKIIALRADVKTELRSNVVVNQAPSPPPDENLHGRLNEIQATLARMQEIASKDGEHTVVSGDMIKVDEDVRFAFAARYSIELELKRMLDATELPNIRRKMFGIGRILNRLVEFEILPHEVASAVKDVYAICSPAIHGEPITKTQADFLRKVTPDLLQTLRGIEPEPFRRGNVMPSYTPWPSSYEGSLGVTPEER